MAKTKKLCKGPAVPDGRRRVRHDERVGMESSGAGISVFATTDEPASVTAVVRRRSGDDSSQSAMTAGELPTFLHQFDFPSVDPSSVLEVVLMKPTGRCYAKPDPEVSAAYPDTQGAR